MAASKQAIVERLKQKKEEIILEMNEHILNSASDRAGLAIAMSVIVRNQMEIIDKQSIIHNEQLALGNLLVDLKNEKKIILPH